MRVPTPDPPTTRTVTYYLNHVRQISRSYAFCPKKR
jgi:hypothetical protein